MRLATSCLGVLLAPGSVAYGQGPHDFSPRFPGNAEVTREISASLATYAFPTGPWVDGGMPAVRAEGALRQAAWRVEAAGIATLALMAPLRADLVESGYHVVFECAASECGGFDFRYAMDVLPEPEMHVDLGDFRFLLASREGPEGSDYLCVLVSRSNRAGFVQLTALSPNQEETARIIASSKAPVSGAFGMATTGGVSVPQASPPQTAFATAVPSMQDEGSSTLAAALQAGSVALEDLAFASGASDLADADYASLEAVARFLMENADRRLAIIGHTDATGRLETNIAISKRRAESVRDRLVSRHGIIADRLLADGLGYLEPRDTNETEAGRIRNRRVEIMLAN